jgi:hypothetical protein
MRHLVLLLSTASAQVRIQYPFGAGPVVVQCPSGDITVTCGEAPVADDPAMGALRQQVVAMEARIARLVDEAGKASVAAAVSATGHVEVASRGKPAPSSAAAELWPPPSAAESALLSRLELTSAQLYSSADLDLSSRHLDDSDSLTLAGLLAARGASGLRALRRLWLSENRIGDEGAAAILAALKAAGGLHGLTALYLTNNHLGPPTARTLADALGGGGGGGGAAELLELNLSENQLGDLGLQLLVEKLSLAPRPQQVETAFSVAPQPRGHKKTHSAPQRATAAWEHRLSGQLCTPSAPPGGGALSHSACSQKLRRRRQAAPKALIPRACKHSRLPKLEELAISDNQLGDAGARALAAALAAGAAPRLRRLLLDHNKLGGGAAALGGALGGAARLASPPLAQARHTAASLPPPRLPTASTVCPPTHPVLSTFYLPTTTTPAVHCSSRSHAARAARPELQSP